MRRSALATLLLALLCGAYTAQAGSKFSNWFKGKVDDLATEALAHGADGLSEKAARWAEQEGEPEFAAVIRASGDAFEASVLAVLDATACAGSLKVGASVGAAAGCFVVPVIGCIGGALLGGALGGFITPACHRAVGEVETAVNSALEAIDAAKDYLGQCDGRSFATDDGSDCAIACAEQAGTCAEVDWYFDRGCCLCKYTQTACQDSSTGSGGSTEDTTSAPSSQRPTTSGGGSTGSGTCGSIEYDTDYFGGDIVPATTKWADTAVAAASPEDCCEACSLYSYCGAWTFTSADNCKERFPGAPGCCFLKKGTGYEKRSASGMVSGTSGGRPVAACTLEFDTDFAGGDIQSGNGPDTVVPTISDADCCQSCASTPGCGAWTMGPPSDCSDRLPNARGCCFLKHEGGWTRTKDEKGVLTSGQLL